MAHGIEVRYPFLDPDVIELCNALPDGLKLRGLADKVLLRHVAARRLPADIWQRPKKPYRAPMTQPFFGPHAPEYVSDLLAPVQLKRLGLVDPRRAGLLVDKARRQASHMSGEREEMALIGVLTLQLLAQAFRVEMPDRAASAYRRLMAHEPGVLVDRVDAGRGSVFQTAVMTQ